MDSSLTPGMRALAAMALAWGASAPPSFATERVFVLTASHEIRQFKIDARPTADLEATYTASQLPALTTADSLAVTSGNWLRLADARGGESGAYLLDPVTNRLTAPVTVPADLGRAPGRILTEPDTRENFRGANSLYSAAKDPAYAAGVLRATFRRSPSSAKYRDLFVLDGVVFGTIADRIECLSERGGTAVTGSPSIALTLAGSSLGRVAVSPWGEAFIADTQGHALQRIVWRNGHLEANGTLTHAALTAPSALGFSSEGELLVAGGTPGAEAVLRFRFVLDNFVTWRAVPHGTLAVAGAAVQDLALARPVGYVLSEATHPLVSAAAGPGNAHHGIAQAIFISPTTNSETATLALVEYAPGGFTVVHKHPDMEQVEIVVSGRALWEVGETEREVGPGDVVFCPRNVKHGYKVIGDQPFKFYQVEWREWSITH